MQDKKTFKKNQLETKYNFARQLRLLREEKVWPDGSLHSTVLYGKLKQEWLAQNNQ